MSGKPLFPLAIHVAKALSEATSVQIVDLLRAGFDPHNIASVLACGIAPVTVATLLLKTGGYQNLTRLAALVPDRIPHQVDCEKLRALCDSILSDPYYQKQEKKSRARNQTAPPAACFKCKNCVDVCPNRANFPLPDLKSAIHMDSYCNECGNCACLCPFGYVPYRDKFTYFDTLEDFESSQNDGFFGHEKYRYLGQTGTDVSALPEEVRQVIDVFLNQGGQNV